MDSERRIAGLNSAGYVGYSAYRSGHILALIGILVLGVALRLHGLTSQSLGYDELGSMSTAAGRNGEGDLLPRGKILNNLPILTSLQTARPTSAVITSLKNDNHPPLYFLTLRFWMDCFGEGDYSARALSVVFSVIAIVLLFDAARISEGTAPALWACLIMALAIPQVRYAQETRMYTMSLAAEMLAIAALIRIERMQANGRRLWMLGTGLSGMLFSNYLSAPSCLAIGIYAVARLKGNDRRRVMRVGMGVIILFVALCGPLMWMQRGPASHQGAYWEWDYASGHLGRTLFRAGAIPMELMQPPLSRAQDMAEIGAVLFVLPFLIARRRPAMLLWGLILALPVVFIMGVDFYRTSNELTRIRYLLLASPGEYIMLASLLSGQGKPLWRWIMPAVAAVGCVIALPAANEADRLDFHPAAVYLDQHIRVDEPVVFSGGSWGPNITGASLLGLSRYSHAFPRTLMLLDNPAPADVAARLKNYPRVWFFCAGPQSLAEYLPGFINDEERYFIYVGYLQCGHWAGTKK